MNEPFDIASIPISINDLKDRYYSGEALSDQEKTAVINYDKYRLDFLNSAKDGDEFDKRYLQLQAQANLAPFTDFL